MGQELFVRRATYALRPSTISEPVLADWIVLVACDFVDFIDAKPEGKTDASLPSAITNQQIGGTTAKYHQCDPFGALLLTSDDEKSFCKSKRGVEPETLVEFDAELVSFGALAAATSLTIESMSSDSAVPTSMEIGLL